MGIWGQSVRVAVVGLMLAGTAACTHMRMPLTRAQVEKTPNACVDFTASLLDKPGGRVLVIIIGIAVIAVGAYHVYKGAKKKFLQDLQDHPGTWATRAGRVGYIAKGVALVIVGFLFCAAGVHKQAKEASGLDGALKSLRDQPFGPALLVVMAVGFAAFGLYSFSRAKHAKV